MTIQGAHKPTVGVTRWDDLIVDFGVLFITLHREGVKRCYWNRTGPLGVPDLPIPTTTLNSAGKPDILNPLFL